MGIFNEQKDNSFAKGIQGAPGVGFNLTSDGDYDMINKKIRNVGTPTANTDAATKKYIDDNSSGAPKTSRLTVDSNIDMKDRFRILNLKHPNDADEPATKQYADSNFLNRDGSRTMIGNLSMNNNKIIKVAKPTVNDDVANKKYVDDKPTSTSKLTIDSNIDMKNTYRITNLSTPLDGKEPPTKEYVDNTFLDRDGSYPMKGDLNMNYFRIINLQNPSGPRQPTPLAFTDIKYLHVGGTNKMLNSLNMNNKSIISLRTPFNDTDAATKKYVDDKSFISGYLKKDGTDYMSGNLNMNNKKIISLSNPTQDNDAVNKDYVDKLIHHTAVQPSHYNDQFTFLMSNAAQWTDEIDTGTSFVISKIADLPASKGNFHNYNHKVIYVKINKNSQGGYKYKMSVNFYRLTANVDYTLCLEILNTDYQLWHKSQISVDKGTSTGLSIENVSVKKLSHRYIDSTSQEQYMYYHRIIVNFKKLSTGNRFFLHFLVNIPQEGADLSVYPRQFSGVYFITYGIVGKVSNIDPDKVYDYHTAFDIKPTEVTYNVDINANNKKILNIDLDKNNNNSAATVGMVNEINTATVGIVNKNLPFIKNYVYRKYFDHFFDFSDSNNYVLNKSSIGVVFNSLASITGKSAQNITFPSKTMDNIKETGLRINNYKISFKPPIKNTSYTLCIVFSHFKRNNFHITKYDVTNANSRQQLLFLYYLYANRALNINIGNVRKNLAIPSSFSGKKIVLWLTESINDNITKVNISNYSADLDANIVRTSANLEFEFLSQDSVIEKFMYSPNFYDIDSSVHHQILLQEKLKGNYVL